MQRLKLDPKYVSVYSNRGNLYLEKYKLKEAINDYTKAIDIAPDFYPLYSTRSVIKALDKDFAGAKADNDKALKLGLSKQIYDENNKIIQKAKDLSASF